MLHQWRVYLVAGLTTGFLTAATALRAEEAGQQVTWWVAADPHVGRRTEEFSGQHLSKAVADVRAIGIADHAILPAEYNIVAWFSGHKHRWDIREDSGEGFIQVNIHSLGGVRENYLSSFLHLDRQGDTVEVTVRFRNHETQEWIEVDGKDRFTFSVELPGR